MQSESAPRDQATSPSPPPPAARRARPKAEPVDAATRKAELEAVKFHLSFVNQFLPPVGATHGDFADFDVEPDDEGDEVGPPAEAYGPGRLVRVDPDLEAALHQALIASLGFIRCHAVRSVEDLGFSPMP